MVGPVYSSGPYDGNPGPCPGPPRIVLAKMDEWGMPTHEGVYELVGDLYLWRGWTEIPAPWRATPP